VSTWSTRIVSSTPSKIIHLFKSEEMRSENMPYCLLFYKGLRQICLATGWLHNSQNKNASTLNKGPGQALAWFFYLTRRYFFIWKNKIKKFGTFEKMCLTQTQRRLTWRNPTRTAKKYFFLSSCLSLIVKQLWPDTFVNSQEWTLSRDVPVIRIGVIGSTTSGKTALVHRYLTGAFIQEDSPGN